MQWFLNSKDKEVSFTDTSPHKIKVSVPLEFMGLEIALNFVQEAILLLKFEGTMNFLNVVAIWSAVSMELKTRCVALNFLSNFSSAKYHSAQGVDCICCNNRYR